MLGGNCRILLVAALICVIVCTAVARCPANGNTHVLYATTNMARNILAYDTSGKYLGEVLNVDSLPQSFRVDKLRGMVLGPDGRLYVSSARGQFSSIFAISGNGVLNGTMASSCTRNFLFEVVSLSSANPYMDHPYAFLFHPEDGSLYVANQNSVTVTRYVKVRKANAEVAADGKPVLHYQPAPNSEFVQRFDTGNVTNDAGVFAHMNHRQYQLTSVRGIALSPLMLRHTIEDHASLSEDSAELDKPVRYLLVCDILADAVVVFDAATGAYLFSLSVPAPVQVMFPHSAFVPTTTTASGGAAASQQYEVPVLYVTSKDGGRLYQLPFHQRGARLLTALNHPNPGHSLSGITESVGHSVLYVADRNGRKIGAYTASSHVTAVIGSSASPPSLLQNRNDDNNRALRGTSPDESNNARNSVSLFHFGTPSQPLGYFNVALGDQPEFLLLTQVELQANIPFCYELDSDGSLRYTELCVAGLMWFWVVVLAAAAFAFLLLRQRVIETMKKDAARKPRRSIVITSDGDAEAAPLRRRTGAYGSV